MKDFFILLFLILVLLVEVYNFENKAKVISGNIGLPIDDAWIHLTYLIILLTYLYLKTKKIYLVSFLCGILTLTRPEGAILFLLS